MIKKWLVALLFALTSIFVMIPASYGEEEDQNFHEICIGGKSTQPNPPAECVKRSAFIQRRIDCGKTPCFGVGNFGWHTDLLGYGECEKGCVHTPFSYATLEYRSDLGEYATRWQKEQIDTILEEIKNSKKKFIVVFIHGWHNNAQETIGEEYPLKKIKDDTTDYDKKQNHNLRFFKALLAKTKYELMQRGEPDRELFGIYIGWNAGPPLGLKFIFPQGLFNVTDRALAADRIGRSADLAEDLKALSHAVAINPTNRMLVIGHSFGGRLISRYFVQQHQKQKTWEPLGRQTLIATLNAAIGADAFTPLRGASEIKSLPSLVHMTSEDDWATEKLLPYAADGFGSSLLFGKGMTDDPDQAEGKSAMGHFKPLFTHRFWTCAENSENEKCTDRKNPEKPNWWEVNCANPVFNPQSRNTRWYYIPAQSYVSCSQMVYGSNRSGSEGKYRIAFSRKPGRDQPLYSRPMGMMWNVTTDSTVLGGEGDYKKTIAINHNAFVQTNLLRALIELTFARK